MQSLRSGTLPSHSICYDQEQIRKYHIISAENLDFWDARLDRETTIPVLLCVALMVSDCWRMGFQLNHPQCTRYT